MAVSERSSIHPSATWAECIELINKLDSLGRKPVSNSVLAEAFGLKNPKTKSLQAKITSSRLFGLITVKNGAIALTDSGHDILHPTTSNVRPLEQDCFIRPALYSKLLEAFDGKSLPREDLFENILVKEYGLSEISKKRAAKCFKESAEELGFLVNGVVYSKGVQDDGQLANEESSSVKTDVSSESDAVSRAVGAPAPAQLLSSGSDESSFTISAPVQAGGMIEIRVPVNAEASDFELAKDLLDVFEKRKRSAREEGGSIE